jgi:hypothetical protein
MKCVIILANVRTICQFLTRHQQTHPTALKLFLGIQCVAVQVASSHYPTDRQTDTTDLDHISSVVDLLVQVLCHREDDFEEAGQLAAGQGKASGADRQAAQAGR